MKLQYKIIEVYGFKYVIKLYQDGKIINSYEVWVDEVEDEREKLEEQGYTYGYTSKEVEEIKEIYERMLANIIE